MRPQNFDGYYRGTVTVREALVQSLNIPAVAVLDAVGPARLVARLKRAAAAPALPDMSAPGLAIGLGGVGVTLRDLVQVYGALARGGSAVTLRDGVDDPAVRPLSDAGAPVLDPQAAWYVADILAGMPPPLNGSTGLVAYKTGTSYGFRDAWAVGFDGDHVVGVWVGRPDGTPVPGLSGITGAAPILFEAFDRLGRRRAPLKRPPAGTLVAVERRPSAAAQALPGSRRGHRRRETPTRRSPFPLDGVEVDLGIKAGDPMPLMIKVRNGAPPFTFFANGIPIGRTPFDRSKTWEPDGPGFVTLSVVEFDRRIGPGDGVRGVAGLQLGDWRSGAPPLCHSGRSEAESRNPEKVERLFAAIALFCSGFRVAASPRPERQSRVCAGV